MCHVVSNICQKANSIVVFLSEMCILSMERNLINGTCHCAKLDLFDYSRNASIGSVNESLCVPVWVCQCVCTRGRGDTYTATVFSIVKMLLKSNAEFDIMVDCSCEHVMLTERRQTF